MVALALKELQLKSIHGVAIKTINREEIHRRKDIFAMLKGTTRFYHAVCMKAKFSNES